jgi:SAM-dependent methyltransferase
MTEHGERASPFHEAVYDGWLGDYYDIWYPPDESCFQLFQRLIAEFADLQGRDPATLNVWDCACGTGTTFTAMSRAGYRPWASDGSPNMLGQAARKCLANDISTTRLIDEPLAWNDHGRCRARIGAAGELDIIAVLNNSLCHMPVAPGYLDAALSNFFAMLKPGGRLIVDTKRYVKRDVGGIRRDWELRFVEGEWRPRTTRRDGPRSIPSRGDTYFHTSLVHDVDPTLEVDRALLVVTIESSNVPRETHLVPYYPLSAAVLISELQRAGFVTSLHEARTPPLDWSYDCVVATRPPHI